MKNKKSKTIIKTVLLIIVGLFGVLISLLQVFNSYQLRNIYPTYSTIFTFYKIKGCLFLVLTFFVIYPIIFSIFQFKRKKSNIIVYSILFFIQAVIITVLLYAYYNYMVLAFWIIALISIVFGTAHYIINIIMNKKSKDIAAKKKLILNNYH